MRMLMVIAVSVAAVATVALAQQAASPANEVQLVRDASQVAGCRRLGEVAAKSSWGGIFQQATYNRMLKQFKDKAQAIGGTHILVVDMASGYTGTRLLGNAYHCP